jgi:hypothetical protein
VTPASEDSELYGWLLAASVDGGNVVQPAAIAALNADRFQYEAIRPAIVNLKAMYPRYGSPLPPGYPSSTV